MFFCKNKFALVKIAVCTRSWEPPLVQGKLCIRFAAASYCANASMRRLRTAEASAVGRSSLLHQSGISISQRRWWKTDVRLSRRSWN